MKLAISNIAWETSEDDAIGARLKKSGVMAVELAPTKYWSAPCNPAPSELTRVRSEWAARGQRIVALQSLLFGQPELSIFGSDDTKRRTADYLSNMLAMAHGLGAKVLVFGSPRNRDRGARSFDQAVDEAADFFLPLAARASDSGCVIGFEPNPSHYKCNFCTNVAESLQFIGAVGHPGFRLHLDTGIMALNSEAIAATVAIARAEMCHVHLSEPELAVVGSGPVDHARVALALRETKWDGYVSIEMRAAPGSNLEHVQSAVDAARRFYL